METYNIGFCYGDFKILHSICEKSLKEGNSEASQYAKLFGMYLKMCEAKKYIEENN